MSAPAEAPVFRSKQPKPVVMYDFGQARIAEHLPPMARDALRRNRQGTHQLEAELRNYLKYRGLDEVRPIKVLKIVSRYVFVRPLSFGEMEASLGRIPARDYFSIDHREVPPRVWWIQDFLDYLDAQVGFRMRREINSLLELRNPAKGTSYAVIANRHLRRAGYDWANVIRWIKEDPRRHEEFRKGLAKYIGVRP